jgi:lysophospholipase L1-like esterase
LKEADGATSSVVAAGLTVDGLKPRRIPGLHRVFVDGSQTLGTAKTVERFWLANPVDEWMTLGAYRLGQASWTPLYPGTYQIVSMTRAPGQTDATAQAVEETVQVRVLPHAYVALGDSVSFGWNLGNNWNPSPKAFPFLLGKAVKLPVDDLGYPGWTTSNLLNALPTARYRNALATASLVTIDIGNNDLLQPATKDGLLSKTPPKNLTAVELQIEGAVQTMATNIAAILVDVQQEAPHARILLYNLYNPIQGTNSEIGQAASILVQAADSLIAKDATHAHVTLVNAYSAFQGHQAVYVQSSNFHPTVAGQVALAEAGELALNPTAATDTHAS